MNEEIVNVKVYVNDDGTKMVTLKDLETVLEGCHKENKRLHSIIKEVRRIAECYERIEGHYTCTDSFGRKVETFDDTTKEELLEILDKGE